MKVVREFEERAAESGHHSLIKDAVKYAKELDLDLKLSELNPTCRTAGGNEVSGKQIGVWAKRAQQQQLRQEITKEKWQGKLLKIRWEDDQLSRSCFDSAEGVENRSLKHYSSSARISVPATPADQALPPQEAGH